MTTPNPTQTSRISCMAASGSNTRTCSTKISIRNSEMPAGLLWDKQPWLILGNLSSDSGTVLRGMRATMWPSTQTQGHEETDLCRHSRWWFSQQFEPCSRGDWRTWWLLCTGQSHWCAKTESGPKSYKSQDRTALNLSEICQTVIKEKKKMMSPWWEVRKPGQRKGSTECHVVSWSGLSPLAMWGGISKPISSSINRGNSTHFLTSRMRWGHFWSSAQPGTWYLQSTEQSASNIRPCWSKDLNWTKFSNFWRLICSTVLHLEIPEV